VSGCSTVVLCHVMSSVQLGVAARHAVRAEWVLVGLVAVIVRLAITWAAKDSGIFSDMADYHLRAHWVLEGKEWTDSFRGPGYPVFLAALYRLWDPDLAGARIGNALLGGVTATMTCLLAADFVPRRAALCTGLVVALYPAAVLSSVYVMAEGLYGALVLAALLVGRTLNVRRAATAGALAGAAALTRSLGLSLVGVIATGHLPRVWRDRDWRRFALCISVMAAVSLLTLLPWFRHTTRVSGGVMLDSSSAYNVLLGANPRAQKRLHIPDGSWVWETYFAGAIDEADRNRRALRESWTWIRSNPGRWLSLMPAKMGYLYGLEGREHAWAYSNSYFGPRAPLTVRVWGGLLLVSFPPLAVLAIVGLLRPGLLDTSTGLQIAAFLAVTTLLHGVSFSETRYHLPLIPLLAVLAARGAAGGTPMPRARWVAALALGLSLSVVWWEQAPELLDRYRQLLAPEGWRTMLEF